MPNFTLLYTHFIFRDVLAYVIPGIFLLLNTPTNFTNKMLNYSSTISGQFQGYPALFFIFLGYLAIQMLQGLVSLVAIRGVGVIAIWDRFTRDQYFGRERMFIARTSNMPDRESLQLYRERIAALRLAAGNFSIACMVALILKGLALIGTPNFSIGAAIVKGLQHPVFWVGIFSYIAHWRLSFIKVHWEDLFIGEGNQ